MKLFREILCIAAIGLMASCSNKNEHLENLIPADAAGVVCVNMPNVLEKSGIKSGDDLVVPDQLKAVIKANDDQEFGQMIKNLPAIGIEIKEKAYVYFPNEMCDFVMLVALNDEDKAKALITHKTGAQFADHSGVDYVMSGLNVWCVADDILMLGHLRQSTDVKKAVKWLAGVLNYEGKSIVEVEEAKGIFTSEDEVSAFFNMRHMNSIIKSNAVINSLAKTYPIMQLLVDSDVKAVTFSMTFNGNKGDMKANIIMDEDCQFATLLKAVLSGPSNAFLKAVPNTMEMVMALSVNGKSLIRLPQVQQMARMVNEMPFLGSLDVVSIIESIDGSIAVGLAQDPVFEDEYNYVFAAQSSKPDDIVNLISQFASLLGQDPELVDGEYIYAYNNKQVRLGIIGDVVYVKMLNYEQTEANCDGFAAMSDFFGASPLGVYCQIRENGVNADFSFGLTDLHNASGTFVTNDKNGNALLQFITAICSIKPISSYDYDMSEPEFDEQSMVGEFHAF
ncbi:MAG: DUF4836 family protein [Muribaculaceae bacterium]